MRRNIFNKMVLLSTFLTIGILANAHEFENENKSSLFKIGRSKDANEIFYEVKTTAEGSLDLNDPIKIYWIKNTKNGKTASLTRIQQHFAYGLKFIEISPEKVNFQFVSYSKRTLTLRKNRYGNYRVYMEVQGKEVELKRVYIQIDGGTFWVPKITRVEIYAKIPEDNKLVVELIKP